VGEYKKVGQSILNNILTEKKKAEKCNDYKEQGRFKKEIRKLEVELESLKKKSDKDKDRRIWK
jgi:hypothetical protein